MAEKTADLGSIGRVSRPTSGEHVPQDGVATDLGNDLGRKPDQLGNQTGRQVAMHERGGSRSRPQKHAGDVPRASRNYPHPGLLFFLPCEFCSRPMRLKAGRYRDLFDAQTKPVCGKCRRYESDLQVIQELTTQGKEKLR